MLNILLDSNALPKPGETPEPTADEARTLLRLADEHGDTT